MRVRRPMWTFNFRSLVCDTFSRIAKYRMRENVLYSVSSEIEFYTAKAHFYLRLYNICLTHICSVLVSHKKRIAPVSMPATNIQCPRIFHMESKRPGQRYK